MRLIPRHIRFHVSISALVLFLVLATAGLSLLTVIGESSRTADKTAEHQFRQISERVQDRLATLVGEVEKEAAILAAQPTLSAPIAADGSTHPGFPLLSAILRNKPVFYSAYFAHRDGSFLQVIATRDDHRILEVHKAPAGTELIVRSITVDGAGSHSQHWIYLGAGGQRLGRSDNGDFSYDPRNRVWFGMAAEQVISTLSPPYLFDSLKAPGISAAHRLDGADGVVGVDLTLTGLQAFLDEFEVSPHGGVMLLDEQSRIMAFSGKTLDKREWPEPMDGMAAHRRYPFTQVMAANPAGLTLAMDESRPIIVYRTVWGGGTTTPIHLAIFAPERDFTGHIDVMRRHILIINGVLLLIILPIVSWSARRLARPVDHLARDADRIRVWDLSGTTPTGSIIVEIDSLARAFIMMKRSLIERTRKLEQTQDSLRKLVDLAIALAAERDGNRVMDMILSGAKDLAHADGGTLYIRDDDRMIFRIMKNDSLNIDMGGDGQLPDVPWVPLFEADGAENHRHVVSHSVHLRQPTTIENADTVADLAFSGTHAFDERHGYRSIALLTVPLAPRGGEPLGALQLINPLDPETGEIVAFSSEIERFVQALSALAATALDNRSLLESQKTLMNSLIKILASAIDAKSPYTGAHCERVPELAVMLAKEACDAQTGPLADFRFDTEEQWDEFRIGAWLHDCGKVTTPEYVIDKATKLETIHNRIHEIRTRFEVLLRDAEIAMLEARLANAGDAAAAMRRFDEQCQALFDDFAFIATCNIGGEFMDPDKIERLKSVAQHTWVRHFDDRLGLSHGELSRLADTPAMALPAVERLLSDKPEHIIVRDSKDGVFEPRFGFKMSIPEHLYNLGEIYNLSVSRGTLTPEERFKINEHIVQTIIMLDSLAFPKHLRRVPEYAGTHHETLIGTGYPRRLTGAQLSIPARIMVIADIFEALTAADRPYKKPKTLSDAVEILSQFAKKQHIDPDLFHLFLKSGVYRRYAEAFLSPEQNDRVDIERYLGAEEISPV